MIYWVDAQLPPKAQQLLAAGEAIVEIADITDSF